MPLREYAYHHINYLLKLADIEKSIEKDRKCTLCNLNNIEDEFHVMLVYPLFQELRQICIKKIYYRNLNMYKFISMLNSSNLKVFNAIGIYYTKANHTRKSILNVVND